MSNKEKWITVLVCFCILILFAAAGIYKRPQTASGIETIADLKGRSLGGVEGRMPENSSKIFFESMLGVKLGSYKAFGNMDEALYALRTGRVAAVWAADITADYLIKANTDLKKPDKDGMADIASLPEGRFEFGMAVKKSTEGEAIVGLLNKAIDSVISSREYAEAVSTYILNADQAAKFTVSDMTSETPELKKQYSGKAPLRVGITGAAPPIELIDESGRPYGFCVVLMDMIAQQIERNIEFVVLDNETLFTSLMSGRIDAVFCYGTPGRVTTEGTAKWITTDGYLNCKGYDFLTTD